ncbi:MAG: hypothetical protein MPK01_00880 [Gammaproteobacteria bacterium]|nr:hypothetical protein [Gammaproteobacteria bacterium]MDA7994824.1 hypothetical protein [Gammaproteobacteria bacterium]MDA8023434.1 hypothetical protein [Gammaproteobacteria bacterium]
MSAYEENLLRLFAGGDYEEVGWVATIVCEAIQKNSLFLSWYVDIFERIHPIPVTLPKEQLIVCVECWEMGEKPRFFVKHDWLENLYLQTHSVFCWVDAINFKKSLENGNISRDRLVSLRGKIDDLGKEYPQIVFISFADTLLLKSNWTVGYYPKGIKNTYDPEVFIEVVSKLADIYREVLGLDVYAILTQGSNGYYDDSLLHVSDSGNHISLNSLGIPFSDLKSIEDAVKRAIKHRMHQRAQLYMDESFYRSLKFKSGLRYVNQSVHPYESKMRTGGSRYYPNDIEVIKNALSNE